MIYLKNVDSSALLRDCVLEAEAREDYKNFLKTNDHRSFLSAALSKKSAERFADQLFIHGYFCLQLDDKNRDEKITNDIDFILGNTKALKTPKRLINQLTRIGLLQPFFQKCEKERDQLDEEIAKILGIVDRNKFVQEVLFYLDQNPGEKKYQYPKSEDDVRNRPNDIDVSAAATYLIRRSSECFPKLSKSRIPLRDLFSETQLYLFHKRLLFESCYFMVDKKEARSAPLKFGKLQRQFYAGVTLQFSFQQTNTSLILRELSQQEVDEKPEEVRKQWLAQTASAIGLPPKVLCSSVIFGNLTYGDIRNFAEGIATALGTVLLKNGYSGNQACTLPLGLLRLAIGLALKDIHKSEDLLSLAMTVPEDLVDLYLTPFVKTGDSVSFSLQLIMSNNWACNLEKRASAVRGKNEDKGAIFERSIREKLATVSSKIVNHKYSFSAEGASEAGDIDAIGIVDNQLVIAECKAESVSLNEFDYRRDFEIMSTAQTQLKKSFCYLKTAEGQKWLSDTFGSGALRLPIFPCVISSNCRTSCVQGFTYPVFSLFELNMALENGHFFSGGFEALPYRSARGPLSYLDKKLVPSIYYGSLFMQSFLSDDGFEMFWAEPEKERSGGLFWYYFKGMKPPETWLNKCPILFYKFHSLNDSTPRWKTFILRTLIFWICFS